MEIEIVDLLAQVNSSFRAKLQHLPVLEELSLPSYQARLLVLVGRCPGWSQQQLANATERDKAQVARSVKELETRGLLTRTPDVADGRVHGVVLTETGSRTARRLNQERANLARKVLKDMDRADQRLLAELLTRLSDALGCAAVP